MLQITSDYRGEFQPDLLCIASSAASPYMPLMVMNERNRVGSRRSINHFYTYNKPLFKQQGTNAFNINNFFNYLNERAHFVPMWLDAKRENKIHIGKGCLCDDDKNILLMLSIKSGKDVNYSRFNTPEKEHVENLTLFISTEMMMNPIYDTFYKKLYRGYILEAFKLDLPVIFTTSKEIDKLHYSNDFNVEFDTVDIFQQHLQENVGKILSLSNTDFENFNPGIGKNLIPVIPASEVTRASLLDEMNLDTDMISEQIRRREDFEQAANAVFNSQSILATTGDVGIDSYIIGADPYLVGDPNSISIINTGLVNGPGSISPSTMLHISTTESAGMGTTIPEASLQLNPSSGIQLIDDREVQYASEVTNDDSWEATPEPTDEQRGW